MLRRLQLLIPVVALGCAKGIDPPEATRPVFIQGGTFTMGGDQLDPCDTSNVTSGGGLVVGCQDAHVQTEVLQHPVQVGDFCIDEHEVTIDQYRHCVARGDCSDPKATNAGDPSGANPIQRYYRNFDKYGGFPVLGVTHDQAEEFCEFTGGRLPTEAEWEFTARSRGATDRAETVWADPNPVGACTDHKGDLAYGDCGNSQPQKVGTASLDTTEQGVKDLAGNAQEWVADGFSFFTYCADDQGDGQKPEDLYTTVNQNEFQRKPQPDADVQTALLAAGQTEACVDLPNGDPGNNKRAGGCLDKFTDCGGVCGRAWKGNVSTSTGQAHWKDEECREVAGVASGADAPICGQCADGDTVCQMYCDCVDQAEPADSGGECVQRCLADAVACLKGGCAGADVGAACINVNQASDHDRKMQVQPICHVRHGDGGGPFVADGPRPADTSGALKDFFVVRGGFFQETQACGVRPSRREPHKGSDPSSHIGFRCAYDAASEVCTAAKH